MKVPMPQMAGQSYAWADQKTWSPLCVWTPPSSRLEPPVWATAEPRREPAAAAQLKERAAFLMPCLELPQLDACRNLAAGAWGPAVRRGRSSPASAGTLVQPVPR
eukprot:COSAG04_NODE_4433_length_2095_cov_2.964930_2_plen_105_part_00